MSDQLYKFSQEFEQNVPSRNAEETEGLLRKAMRGDQDAMNGLFHACIGQLRATATRFFRNFEDVEDIVQASMLAAYRNFGQYQGRSKFSTWLHSILVNEALMELRKRKSRSKFSVNESVDYHGDSYEIPVPDPAPNPEEECTRKELHALLIDNLERLPLSLRLVLRTYYFQELGIREGAEALSMTRSNFKSRLCHGRRALSKSLRQAHLWRNIRTTQRANAAYNAGR